ncbi:MAG: hypothetical protein ACXVRZ_13445 [Gaiellaceae bacterium]
MRCYRFFITLLVVFSAALGLSGPALATGGNYVFDGGTPAEQATVRAALNASSFDWSLVPGQVTIHIQRGIAVSESVPGQTWLDANLLDSGTFSWGVVQMEYAQQVQFRLLDDQQRAGLVTALHAKDWCYEVPGTSVKDNACERFAAALAWAYWPSPKNCMKPAGADDASAAMAPAAFRALVTSMLGASAQAPDLSYFRLRRVSRGK